MLDLIIPKNRIEGVNYIQVDLLKEAVPESISDAGAIVHLSGASIFNRWTPEYKKLIYDSRILTAQKLIDFFEDKKEKPEVFVSASAVGIYGSRGEEILTEDSLPGDDFLAHVCVDWEKVVSLRWITFAFALALSNQIALMYFTPKDWVYYKMGTLIALVLFSVWQFVLSHKERNPGANPWGMRI
ncbi:MAG: NAD-dependent epimerase/dehydratase family protein [Candidatus Paceibacterota bacterium]